MRTCVLQVIYLTKRCSGCRGGVPDVLSKRKAFSLYHPAGKEQAVKEEGKDQSKKKINKKKKRNMAVWNVSLSLLSSWDGSCVHFCVLYCYVSKRQFTLGLLLIYLRNSLCLHPLLLMFELWDNADKLWVTIILYSSHLKSSIPILNLRGFLGESFTFFYILSLHFKIFKPSVSYSNYGPLFQFELVDVIMF